MSKYNSSSFPPVDPNSAHPNLKIEKHESDEFSTNEGTHIAQQDDKNNIQTKKQDKLLSSFKIGDRTVKIPNEEELKAAKDISESARKEGNKPRIGMGILGAAVAIASVAAAFFTGGLSLIGLAAAALVVGIGVVAGNRRESGTQAAYAQTEQDQRNTFQLEGNQTAAERFQDVKAFMKEKKAQEKAEEKASKKNFNAKEFSKGLDKAWKETVSNITNQTPASTPQEIQNSHQNPEENTNTTQDKTLSLSDVMTETAAQLLNQAQQTAPGSQGILQRQGSPFDRSKIPGLSQPRSKSATMPPRSSTNANNEAIQQMIAGATSIPSSKSSPKTMPLLRTGNTSQVDQIVQKSVNSIIGNIGRMVHPSPVTSTTSVKPATTEAGEAAKSKPTKELSFEELTSKAKTTEHNGIKFVNIGLLSINELSDIKSDGSNLPAGDRELFLACKAQNKSKSIKNPFKQYTSTYVQKGGVKDCMKAFKKSCEDAELSYDSGFQENVWEAAWASDIKDPKNPTEGEINAIHDTIKDHVECKDENKLKEIIKSAIALRASFTQNGETSYSSNNVEELAIQFQHPTLQLGKNSENILEGAVLYRNYTTNNKDNNPNRHVEKIIIKTDEKGELYFKGNLAYQKGTQGFKQSMDALLKALQFKPAGDGENFVPSQETPPNIEDALKIFENEAKKAADTTLSDVAETSADTTAPESARKSVSTPSTSAKPATTEADAAAKVADKETTEIKPKFSNKTLATLDNIATFVGKDTADITEEEFVETLQFGSTEVRDVYTAAKDQGLLTKDLLSKLVDKQKECYKDSESGSGSLTEQINTFKKACSEQGISDEAIDAVFKEVEGLTPDSGGIFASKTRNAALTKLNDAGGIKGADGKVLISGDALKTIFSEAVKLRQTAIGNDMTQKQSNTVSLKELTDELEINTLILSEESGSEEGIEKLNGATLNITSGEGDSQQITLSVRDSKVFYKTTPNGEEKELDEAGKKQIQNALVFNGTSIHNGLDDVFEATPSTLETKETLLGDIEKAATEPAETATKPTHKNDAMDVDDDEIGSGDLTKSAASGGASEVDGKSVDATEDELSFKELVSQAESIERRGHRFVSLDKLDIQKFEDIEPDGSNLPAGDREMFIAHTRQGKKFGDMGEFFKICTLVYKNEDNDGIPEGDSVKKCRKDFQNACKSAGISSPEDQEHIWKVVWASKSEDIFEPTDDKVDAIVNTIKGHVGCENKDQLKGIVKSAIAIRVQLAHISTGGYPDGMVGNFAINCECSTLKLGENSDNPIDGAELYVNKGEKYIDYEDGKIYDKATPVSIKTDEDGKLYFEYKLDGTKHTVKEGDDEYETLKQALHDAFVFEPVGKEGKVMPLQEKLNVDDALAVFTEEDKKAADAASSDATEATAKPEDVSTTSAPAEPLDPVAAAAAKVNITIQKSDGHWEYQNIHPLQPEDISNIKNFERKIGDPNTPASITILLKKGIERQEENIKENAEELGWDISKFNISDSQKLKAAKYLQGKYYKKVDQAKMKFEDACAKIGFTTDGQKNFMCQMMQAQLSPSSASKLYNNLSKQIGFKEMNQEDLKKACEAVESLHRIVAHSDSASSEDLKGLSTIIGPIVSMRPVYSEKNLAKFEVNVFANGNHFQNCKIEYETKTDGMFNRNSDTYDIPTGVSYIDPTTKEEKKYELYTVLQITQGPEGSDRFDLWCNDTARKQSV